LTGIPFNFEKTAKVKHSNREERNSARRQVQLIAAFR
jgi:hypothetical protein